MICNAGIYINGIAHNCTGVNESFFADSSEMQGRPCSQHRIGAAAAAALKRGARVRTLGNLYSLYPDKDTNHETPS